MTLSEIVSKLIIAMLVMGYIPCVMYTYGRLNYEYNFRKSAELSHDLWNRNRNLAVIVAIFLSYASAIYLVFNANPYKSHKDQSNFTLRRKKEDPLFHQVVDECPDSFWEGDSAMTNDLKRTWKKL